MFVDDSAIAGLITKTTLITGRGLVCLEPPSNQWGEKQEASGGLLQAHTHDIDIFEHPGSGHWDSIFL